MKGNGLLSILLLVSVPMPLRAAAPQQAAPHEWRAKGGFAALFVADAQAMVRWYAEVLGFRVVMNNPNLRSSTIAQAALLERQGSALELLQHRNPQGEVFANEARDPQELGIIKIGFVVDDLDALEAHLAQQKVPFNHRSLKSALDGMRTFAIRDPEGNTIQFFGK